LGSRKEARKEGSLTVDSTDDDMDAGGFCASAQEMARNSFVFVENLCERTKLEGRFQQIVAKLRRLSK
jgi:hypothetical protein